MSSIPSRKAITDFRQAVLRHWQTSGRHALPWRRTKDPYRILVSEMMLQQTQVARVVGKYTEFLKVFPTIQALARAPLADVLAIWSGLGYNRRAKYLHDAAKFVVAEHKGVLPRGYPSLRAIPGVGLYTANAVRVFAFNEPEVLVETNVRTAITHHFFPRKSRVTDAEITKFAASVAERQDPRIWHSALFDYGSYLKSLGVRNNHRHARYVRQSKFEGSLRQKRGEALRRLTLGLSVREQAYAEALASLARDGLITQREGKWRIA